MTKKSNSALIIWAVVALVVGILLGLLITNLTTTGQAATALNKESISDTKTTDNLLESRTELVLNLLKVNRIENNEEPLFIVNEVGPLSISSIGQNGRVSISGNGDITLNSNEAIQMGTGISVINMYADSANGPKMNLKSHWLTLTGNHIAFANTTGDAAMNINPSGEIQFPNLPYENESEPGNAYACLTADGTLYRSYNPCN